MSTKHFCDRCGLELPGWDVKNLRRVGAEGQPGPVVVSIVEGTPPKDAMSILPRETHELVDLCAWCACALRAWLKERPAYIQYDPRVGPPSRTEGWDSGAFGPWREPAPPFPFEPWRTPGWRTPFR
jgi:hypothetical protein